MRRVVHLVPHTHWDREWYLPLGAFRTRLVAMVDGLIELLGRDSRVGSFLLDGQTVLLEDYLAVRPERRREVERLLLTGRLATGPWYVLADEQMPAGESLLRNLALGRMDLECWGVAGGAVLYSPDAFGHPGSLPMIAREFGIATGVVWRGVDPDLVDSHPMFRWEASGTDAALLVALLPPEGYSLGAELLGPEADLPARWQVVASRIFPSSAVRHGLLMVGADHHAAAPDLGALAERLAVVDQSTEFRFSTLQEFFAAASSGTGRVPALVGELRASRGHAWSLPGVAATRAPFKRRVGEVELLLTRQAEPLVALASEVGGSSAAVVRQAWREVVQSQFHDVLGGCCADPVTRAAEARLGDARAAVAEVSRGAIERLAGHSPDVARAGGPVEPWLILWNPAVRLRGGIVTAEVSFFRRDVLVGPPNGRQSRRGSGIGPFHLRAELNDGRTVTIAPQILEVCGGLERLDAPRHYPDQDEVDLARIAFPLPAALDGLGLAYCSLGSGDATPAETFTAAAGRRLWNGRLMVGIGADGGVALGRLGERPVARRLLTLESERDRGDTYTFCPLRGDAPRRAAAVGRPRVEANGPCLAAIGCRLGLACGSGSRGGTGRVRARLTLTLQGDERFVRGRIILENQANDHRLRLRLPLGLRNSPIRAGAQFGWVERGPGLPHRGRRTDLEAPSATAPAHRWVGVARGNRGMALLLPGFFEYEWTRRGDLLLTLLRSVGELSKPDLATRPGHAGWPVATPEAQCRGVHAVDFALAPLDESELASPDRIERIWEDAFVPVVACWVRQFAPAPAAIGQPVGGVCLDGDGLVFSACQATEDGLGLVLRCFNASDDAVSGSWRLGRAPSTASRVRADGTVIEDIPL
ncbi:MAG: hypothetical protein OEV95_12715, partial [Gemmatimonadota bacterium]|nr:hypothetical protein [Gemmatimonadota bacterium]